MILPTDEDSSVAFQLGPTDPSQHDADRYFEDQGSAFARLRGGNPERAPLFYIFFFDVGGLVVSPSHGACSRMARGGFEAVGLARTIAQIHMAVYQLVQSQMMGRCDR